MRGKLWILMCEQDYGTNTQSANMAIVWSVKGKLHRYIHRVGDDANVATGQKDIWLIFVIIGILQSDLDKLHLDCTQDDIFVHSIHI